MKKLAVALVLVAAAIAGAAVYESKVEKREAAQFSAPGRLVDIGGGRHVHVLCAGKGAPTVVFESSGLEPATEWAALVAEVGRARRACAYDRAGMGWSDPVDGDRTAADFVADLRGALAAAGEHPPYVLVAHSAGGALARAYLAAHRDEVEGLVLVDTLTAWVTTRWPQVIANLRTNLHRGRWLAAVGALRLADPLHLSGRDAALAYRPRTMVAADQLVAATAAALPSLPMTSAVPTVVLTHARGGDWAGPGVVKPNDEAAIEQDWQDGQKQLAKALEAELVVADRSGNRIPAEQPELIVRAIDHVLAPPPAPR